MSKKLILIIGLLVSSNVFAFDCVTDKPVNHFQLFFDEKDLSVTFVEKGVSTTVKDGFKSPDGTVDIQISSGKIYLTMLTRSGITYTRFTYTHFTKNFEIEFYRNFRSYDKSRADGRITGKCI